VLGTLAVFTIIVSLVALRFWRARATIAGTAPGPAPTTTAAEVDVGLRASRPPQPQRQLVGVVLTSIVVLGDDVLVAHADVDTHGGDVSAGGGTLVLPGLADNEPALRALETWRDTAAPLTTYSLRDGVGVALVDGSGTVVIADPPRLPRA
jgi:hypothetical protein